MLRTRFSWVNTGQPGWPHTMKRLPGIAIGATCLAAFSIFVISNTVLAKPPFGRPSIAVFYLPFTDKYFQLATWMWGGGPFLVFAISSLTSMAFWIAIFWKWRLRIPVEGQVQMTSVSDATWPTVLVYNPLPSPYVSTTANPRTGLVRPACL